MKKLTIDQYVPLALVTELPAENITPSVYELRLLHATIGICTEVGELMERLANMRSPQDLLLRDRENVLEELGGAFWYTAIFRDAHKELFATAPKDRAKCYMFTPQGTLNDLVKTSGALLDIAKKTVYYGKVYSTQDILVAFFAVEDLLISMCEAFEFNPDAIRAANINKLAAGYGKKFSVAAANDRDISKEMEALNFKE